MSLNFKSDEVKAYVILNRPIEPLVKPSWQDAVYVIIWTFETAYLPLFTFYLVRRHQIKNEGSHEKYNMCHNVVG